MALECTVFTYLRLQKLDVLSVYGNTAASPPKEMCAYVLHNTIVLHALFINHVIEGVFSRAICMIWLATKHVVMVSTCVDIQTTFNIASCFLHVLHPATLLQCTCIYICRYIDIQHSFISCVAASVSCCLIYRGVTEVER